MEAVPSVTFCAFISRVHHFFLYLRKNDLRLNHLLWAESGGCASYGIVKAIFYVLISRVSSNWSSGNKNKCWQINGC